MSTSATTTPASSTGHRQGLGTFGAYAALEFPFSILTAPIVSVLPPLYAKEYGIELASLSFILLLLRLFDAVSDPLLGYLSDRTQSRFGPRKPWILVGVVLCLWSVWNLFVPPEEVGVYYVGIWLCGVYVGWTLLEVPYRAWSADLVTDYGERARLSLVVRFSGNAALLVFGFLPLFFSPTNEFDFAVLRGTALLLLVLLPLGAGVALFFVPKGTPPPPAERPDLKGLLSAFWQNRALRLWFLALTVGHLGIGTAGALFFVLFDSYLGLGEHFTLVSTTSQLLALASVPLWAALLKSIEKRTLMMIGLFGIACTLPILHFIRPGDWALPLYMVNDALWYTFLMAFEVAVLAMVGDIADAELLRSGQARAGVFCAAWAFSRKSMYGFGAALAYGITGAMGYDPAAETNTDLAVFSLQLVNAGLPALVCAGGALLLLGYPLSRRRHQEIRGQLLERGLASEAS